MHPTYSAYTLFNAKLRQAHLLRHLPRHQPYTLDFSTNDYLGLSQHPAVINAAINAADKFGVGYKASRLVSSNQKQIQDLEKLIAQTKHAPSCLIFNSGFQANISVISALLDEKVFGCAPLVFADRLNHASMHAGCHLAKVKQQRFFHLDYDHLEYLLAKAPFTQPKFILTESVFGMDGDIADLARIVALAKKYNAFVYVDEAHASGLFGKNGYGITEDFPEIDMVMGTFSKALGGSGAYITCHKAIKRYLINRCQGFIFSTGPSPMQVAAMKAAWELIPSLQDEVKVLFQKAALLSARLQALGFDIGNTHTHLIPVILKDPTITMTVQRYLAKQGIRVSAIRPPSVPAQQSRLRIALNITHTDEDIAFLVNALSYQRKLVSSS